MREVSSHWCTTSRTSSTNQYTVITPIDEDSCGPRFGTCTCGKPVKDGIPCQHMVIIVKAMAIDGLSWVKIIPYWWMTAHWEAQYATDVYCRRDVSLDNIKSTYNPDDKLQYCPAFLSVKKGWPKKNACQMSVMDHIEESANKKHKKRQRMFCNLCHKFNHITSECFKHPLNQQKHIKQLKEGGVLR